MDDFFAFILMVILMASCSHLGAIKKELHEINKQMEAKE